jgi:hypothetical protein
MGNCIRYENIQEEEDDKYCNNCGVLESRIILLNDKIDGLESTVELKNKKIDMMESQIRILEKYYG